MRYVYPCVLELDEGVGYSVYFPDVDGAATFGYSLYDALYMAEDALAGMLVDWEDMKAGKPDSYMSNRITEPTPIKDVVAEPDEYSTEAIVTLIKVDTDIYRQVLAETEPRDSEGDDDDLEVPNTYVKELERVTGVKLL